VIPNDLTLQSADDVRSSSRSLIRPLVRGACLVLAASSFLADDARALGARARAAAGAFARDAEAIRLRTVYERFVPSGPS
jgi:hypothetical protein